MKVYASGPRHGCDHSSQFSRATALKQELEERQREKAKREGESGVEWQPRFSSVLLRRLEA